MNDTNKEAMQQQEHMSSDIVAFCELMARIVIRCLKEKDPRVMSLLSFSSTAKELDTGGSHDAA